MLKLALGLVMLSAVGCSSVEIPVAVGLIADENDCRRLWQYTYWVERQLDPDGPWSDESLRAAVDEVSASYGTPIPAFSHCWEVLKVAGYSWSMPTSRAVALSYPQ